MRRIFGRNILTDYELEHYNDDVAYYYKKRGKELEKENYRLYCENVKLKREKQWLENHQTIQIISEEFIGEKNDD